MAEWKNNFCGLMLISTIVLYHTALNVLLASFKASALDETFYSLDKYNERNFPHIYIVNGEMNRTKQWGFLNFLHGINSKSAISYLIIYCEFL